MATFTRTLWETGDTITADGLNGAKGGRGFLMISEADYSEDDGGYIFEVSADLTFADLFDLVVVEGESGTPAMEVSAGVGGDTGDVEYYKITFGVAGDYEFYYDPTAKKLQSLAPQPDDGGGGDDIG